MKMNEIGFEEKLDNLRTKVSRLKDESEIYSISYFYMDVDEYEWENNWLKVFKALDECQFIKVRYIFTRIIEDSEPKGFHETLMNNQEFDTSDWVEKVREILDLTKELEGKNNV